MALGKGENVTGELIDKGVGHPSKLKPVSGATRQVELPQLEVKKWRFVGWTSRTSVTI